MKKMALFLIIPCALLLGIQTAKAQQKMKTSANTHPAASAQNNLWNSFRPETLSGTISIVAPGKKEMFLSSSSGASFEFIVTPKTKIKIGGTQSTIAQLADQVQKQATITFVARPKGDIAHSIKVNS